MNVILAAPKLQKDRATAITVKWGKQLLHSLSEIDHIVPIPFIGKNALRSKIEPVLEKDVEKKGVFVFIDHGEDDRLLGADNRPLLDTGNIGLLKNKLVYAVACNSASELGLNALKKGVAGYIGFNHYFYIMPKAAMMFFECFLCGIMEILKHKRPALEAREKTENNIRWYIHKLNNHHKLDKVTKDLIITGLRHNLKSMVCLGDPGWRIV